MSSERDMRKRVVRALKPLDAVSVENGCGNGTPDVNFADGWLELKSLPDWPTRPDTPVRLDHFTPGQRAWMLRRSLHGGRVYLLVKIADDWLLYRGCYLAARLIGNASRENMLEWACAKWLGGLDEGGLLEFLRTDDRAT